MWSLLADSRAFAHSSQLNEAARKISVEWLKHHYVHRYAIKHNRALESLVTVKRRLRLLHIAHAPNAIMKRSWWIGQVRAGEKEIQTEMPFGGRFNYIGRRLLIWTHKSWKNSNEWTSRRSHIMSGCATPIISRYFIFLCSILCSFVFNKQKLQTLQRASCTMNGNRCLLMFIQLFSK